MSEDEIVAKYNAYRKAFPNEKQETLFYWVQDYARRNGREVSIRQIEYAIIGY